MEAKDAISHHGCHWQVVKGVGKVFPDIGVSVLPQALVIEPVNLRDMSALVIPAQNRDAIPVSHLQGD